MRDGRGTVQAAVAVAGAAALLGLAAASGPFFVSSAGTALIQDELEAAGDGGMTLLSVSSSGQMSAQDIRSADAVLQERVAGHGLPEASRLLVVEVQVPDAPDGPTRANLVARDDGSAHLPPVVDGAAGAVAVTAGSAARLGIAAGERLVISDSAGELAEIDVGPIVSDFDRQDMPLVWRPASALLTPSEDIRIPPPPPALVMDTEVLLGYLEDLGHEILDHDAIQGHLVQASWTVAIGSQLTLEQAQELVPRVGGLRAMVADPTTAIGEALLRPGWSPPLLGGQQLDATLTRVESSVAQLAVPVRMLSIAGQIVALAAIGVATVLGGRRRLSHARLWTVRGVAASTLGARWAAAGVLPVAVGLAGGWWLADVATTRLGPGGIVDPSVRVGVWQDLALVGAVGLVVLGLVAGVAARLHARQGGLPRRWPPIAEFLLVVLAGLALWQADARGGTVTVGSDGVLRLDPLAVALPLLLVVAAAGVGTRLLGTFVRHVLGRGRSRRPGWFLAARRLRAVGGATMGLVFLTAAGVGLFMVASTLHASADATVQEKVGLVVGADAILPLPRSSVTDAPTASDLHRPATQVRRAPESVMDGDLVDILAIDPDTFADIAYQPRHLADVDVAELTSRLTGARAVDAPLPAIAVGTPFSGSGSVQIATLEFGIETVGSAEVFPGATGGRPTFVVPDGGPLSPGDPAVTARLAVDVFPELWIDAGDLDDAAFRLELEQIVLPETGVGLGATGPLAFEYAADRRDGPGIAPARWMFTYLRGQATAVAVLAVLALLAHHVLRQGEHALGTAIAGRMGLRRRARVLADLAELGVLAGAAIVLGLLSGVVAARTVVGDYDPVPDIDLPVAFDVPLPLVSAPLGLVAVAVAVTIVVATRRAERIDVASLLRIQG